MQFWSGVALLSLGVNTSFFVGVSALTRQTEAAQYSAELCAADELSQPARQSLDEHSVAEFKTRLSKSLGKVTASREVDIALAELNLRITERRDRKLNSSHVAISYAVFCLKQK